MEGLVYFVVIAFFLVVAVVVASLFASIAGVIGLVVALFIALFKRSRAKVLLVGGISFSLVVVGGLVLLLIGARIWGLAYRFDQAMRLQQEYEEAGCLELVLAEDYTLTIFVFQDGSYEATLEKSDRSQSYIYGITRYAIVDGYMLGEAGFQGSVYYWFWFDLRSGGPGHYFERRAEFDRAVEELNLTEEPVLVSVGVHCETEECLPCPDYQ
jgi:hypothetical protein